jgi:glycosyltransferase involved in cell wall biosynthesis
MKVLQINAVYNIASTGRSTKEIHEKLLVMGYDSYVACSISNVPADDRIYLIGNMFDRKIHALMSRISGKQAYFSNLQTKKLLSFIDKLEPDVICLGNLHSNYVNMPMLLKYIIKNRIATVITLHDFWFMTGKCVHFTENQCYKWKTFCDNCPNLQNGNQSWFLIKQKKCLMIN